MSDLELVRVNIGAGKTYIPGFINVDISSKADITLDLGEDRLPFNDNSADLVFSYHTLEHVPNYLFALSEIYRILRPGGLFLVGLPYVTLTEYNLVNPYHLHNFNEFSFDFFDPDSKHGSAAEDTEVKFKKLFHRFHYMGAFGQLPEWMKVWCRRHLFNVVRKIDFGLIAIKESVDEPPVDVALDAMAEFDRCFKSRIKYKDT